MHKDRWLFLLGGKINQPEANRQFAKAAGGAHAKIVLLLAYRQGWEDFLPHYYQEWLQEGVKRENIAVIVPDPLQNLDYRKTVAFINQATAVFIGGGHTETYYSLYAQDPIKSVIRSRYQQGIPIAGNSAGALILPRTVLLSPLDTDSGQSWIGDGIGLLNDLLLSVHFTQWQDEQNLRAGMKQSNISLGYGIDEHACLVMKNEQLYAVLGKEQVKRIEM